MGKDPIENIIHLDGNKGTQVKITSTVEQSLTTTPLVRPFSLDQRIACVATFLSA